MKRLSVATLLLVSVGLLDPSLSPAQITLDGSLRPGAPSGPVNPVGSTFTIPAGVGEPRGNNLFHSFGEFNVPTNFTAQFTGPSSVRNILSRVTGGIPSSIFGTIDSSSMPTANFFLLNPAGVIFGPGASLHVGGSFHVSTADHLWFGDSPDGGKFFASATPLPVSGLSVNPIAFGFLNPAPVRISVRAGTSLSVESGQTLSVVSGDAPFPAPPNPLFSLPDPDDAATGLTIAGATLRAPSGRINIVSVGPPSLGDEGGRVVLSPTLNVSSFSRMGETNISGSLVAASTLDTNTSTLRASGAGGTVAIRGDRINISSSIVDASGDPSGTVEVRGGRLVIAESSQIQANTGVAKSAPVAIDLSATEEIQVSFSSLLALSVVVDEFGGDALGTGTTGDIKIATNGLQMQGFGLLGPMIHTQSLGQTGGIDIGVSSLRLMDGAQIFSGTGLAAGNVTIVAADSLITSDGRITSQISSPLGKGAEVSLSGGSLTLDGGAVQTQTDSGATGGGIAVTVDTLSVTGGGGITSEASGGAGGKLSITALKSAVVSGDNSRIFSVGTSGSQAGNIEMTVGQLTVSQNGIIQTGDSLTASVGGILNVAAKGPITLSNGGKIMSQAFAQDVGNVVISAEALTIDHGLLQSSTSETGRAGDISVTVGNLQLLNGGQIVTSSQGAATGHGGNLTVTATGGIVISGQSPLVDGVRTPVSPFSTDPHSGLFSTASENNTPPPQLPGDPPAPLGGGAITVSTRTLSLSDGGRISVATPGAGPAGRIVLDVGSLSLVGAARVDSGTTSSGLGGGIQVLANDVSLSGSGTGLFSTAQSTGNAGAISVSAPTVTLTEGARVDSSTTSSGLGGAIQVLASTVSLSGSGTGLFSTAQSTGNAGAISVFAPNATLAGGARVDSSTTSAGHGGNITVNGSSFTISGAGSGLFSDTGPGSGPGGDIKVTSPQIQLLDGGIISASSTGTASALAGSVNIVTNDLTLKGNSGIATTSEQAPGGNISITTTGSLVYLLGSQITTSVHGGLGGGGDITIGSGAHPVDFVILNGGQIRADAFGGPGGNIRIFADTYLTSESIVSASSALSTPGTINIQAKFTNLSGNITQLPETVLQAAALLRAACAARLSAGKTSSLVVAGREGVPLEPGGVMPSPLIAESPTDLAPSRSASEWEPLPGAWRVSLHSKCSM